MAGRTLLDTNAVIAFFSGERTVSERVAQGEVYLSSTILGELYYGALKSLHSTSNLKRIEEFASAIDVLPCDAITAVHYAQIRNRLRAKGRPIPENDIWVAAVAMQYGLSVATRDEHFKEVDGLRLEGW